MPAGSPLDARPTSKPEFDTYRAALVDKLRSLESSPSYAGFLEELVRDLCWNCESPDRIAAALIELWPIVLILPVRNRSAA